MLKRKAERLMQAGGRVTAHGFVGRIVAIAPDRGRSWVTLCIDEVHPLWPSEHLLTPIQDWPPKAGAGDRVVAGIMTVHAWTATPISFEESLQRAWVNYVDRLRLRPGRDAGGATRQLRLALEQPPPGVLMRPVARRGRRRVLAETAQGPLHILHPLPPAPSEPAGHGVPVAPRYETALCGWSQATHGVGYASFERDAPVDEQPADEWPWCPSCLNQSP